MMNFMKRERRNSSNKLDESGAPAKRHSFTFFPKKKSSDVASTGDDNSSSYESDDAPWRAEHFLKGGKAPQDQDWWSDAPSSTDVNTNKADNHVRSLPQNGASPRNKSFRNRGLETWEKTRQAWKESGVNGASSPSTKNAKSKTLSRFRRRDLIRNLLAERRFVLPQRLNLKDLIGLYTEVWDHDSSE